MSRPRAVAGAIVVGGLLAIVVIARRADADIEGGTFSSKAGNVRATVPRGWRVSDQATYPGVILRMFRTRPRGTIILAVDPFPTIEPACLKRPLIDGGVPVDLTPAAQVACHQSRQLETLGFTVGPFKEGAARPWFDYEDQNRQLRQGVVVLGDSIATLVLASDTPAGRAQYARTFDKVLRSLRALETDDDEESLDDAGLDDLLDAGLGDDVDDEPAP